MRARDYFPLGMAQGDAFCNRQLEIKLLVENINSGKHTLLMATRRYGKSSLALRALEQADLPFVEIDFYMANNEKVIEYYLLDGVVNLIGKALGPIDKLITMIKTHVKNLKPKIDIGASPVKLELTVDKTSDPATNIKEGLLLLERLLAEKKKRAVLLLDEFQNVGIIGQGSGIEGAIRHVAQKTKYLTFIFSGSNRKLLKTMFEDENRPLYKLCWKIELKRIAPEHYEKHFQKISKLIWKKSLDPSVIKTIFSLTERHPFYLNKLCDRLCVYHKIEPPTAQHVQETWQQILNEEKSDAIKEISSLSLGQKTLLIPIAKNTDIKLTSKEMIFALQMTSSSIISALEGLEEKDIIEKETEKYQLVNPIIRWYVLRLPIT